MATVTETQTLRQVGDGSLLHVTWGPLIQANADGVALRSSVFSDRSIQIVGTFGAGTAVLQGSNDATPSTWVTLTDPQGNAISATANKMEQVMERTRWVRPVVTGADGTTTLTFTLVAGINNSLRT